MTTQHDKFMNTIKEISMRITFLQTIGKIAIATGITEYEFENDNLPQFQKIVGLLDRAYNELVSIPMTAMPMEERRKYERKIYDSTQSFKEVLQSVKRTC